MKHKKSFITMMMIGSILFISSISTVSIISMQDSSINHFWNISKGDRHLISSTYAENHGYEEVTLSDSERAIIGDKFNQVTEIIHKKYPSYVKKVILYKKLYSRIENKLMTLDVIKSHITDTEKLKTYEKKILFYTEIKSLTHDQIIINIDNRDQMNSIHEQAAAKKAAEQQAAAKKAAEQQAAAKKAAEQQAAAKKAAEQQAAAKKVADTRTRAS